MSNLKSRISLIEKIATPAKPKEIIPILAKAWKLNGKTYYFDQKGQECEFVQSEHKETPIFNFVANKMETGIPDN